MCKNSPPSLTQWKLYSLHKVDREQYKESWRCEKCREILYHVEEKDSFEERDIQIRLHVFKFIFQGCDIRTHHTVWDHAPPTPSIEDSPFIPWFCIHPYFHSYSYDIYDSWGTGVYSFSKILQTTPLTVPSWHWLLVSYTSSAILPSSVN
jgi:hypothetical protein